MSGRLDSLNTRGNVPAKNMAIITNSESLGLFSAFEGATMTGINRDEKMTENAYYPLMEVILFTLMRTQVQEYSEEDLMGFYKRNIHNAASLSDAGIKKLLYELDDDGNVRERKRVIVIDLIPAAEPVIASDEIYGNIVQCIISV